MSRQPASDAAAQRRVITVISDDSEDDMPLVARAARTEVDLTHDEPGPRTRAATAAGAAGAAAHSPPGKQNSPQKVSPKKQSPAKAAAGPAAGDSDGDDAGSGCIICMELMSEAGGHRPATLRCGHIFGEDCIRRWLKQKQRCPQCNKTAKARDVTALFNLPKKVAAGSAGSAVELEQQLQQAQQQAEREHQRARQLEQQLQRMQQELARQRQQPPRNVQPPPPPPRRQAPQQQQQAQLYNTNEWLVPPSGGQPGLRRYDVNAEPWFSAAMQLTHGQHMSDAEFVAFLQHPNTAQYLGRQQDLLLDQLRQRQQAAAGGQNQQQQQLQQQQLQAQREALQAALVGRKRTWQQSLSSDTGGGDGAAAAAAAGPGGLHGRSTLPAAAAAAAAAEARARASGPAEAGFILSPPGNSAPGAGVSGSSAGAGASIGSGARKQVVTLSLSPVQASPASAGCSSSSQFQQQQQFPWKQQQQAVVEVPGSFCLLQEFELLGSRAFDLDVAGTLLTVAEVPAYSELGGCCRLRRISMLAPGTPAFLALPPDLGAVRCLARQPVAGGSSSSSSSALMAAGSDRGGLIIARPSSNNIVAKIPTQAPIWSVAWSQTNEQQLLLGLDRGRLALVDLRMTGSRALLLMTAAPNSNGSSGSTVPWASAGMQASGGAGAAPAAVGAAAAAAAASLPCQPWHSLVMLPSGWQQQHAAGLGEDWVTPEALLACAGGVFCWSSAQPDSFPQLLPSSWHGGTCEGLALAPDGATLAASFRRPLGQSSCDTQPAHWLARLQPAAAAAALPGPQQPALSPPAAPSAAAGAGSQAGGGGFVLASSGGRGGGVTGAVVAGQELLAGSTLRLTGHSSKQQMTHGCFMPPLPDLLGEQLLFASADEDTRTPRLWGCSSGACLLQRQPWQPMSSPVLQLAGGTAAAFNTVLLGALSERQLKVYSYTCGQ